MNIVGFQIENFKRINFVELSIDPKTNSLIITGENEQGKTSLLEALRAGLTGISSKETPKPIKEGADKSNIQIVIADDGTPLYIVERTITEKTNRLTIKSPEGAIYPSPQSLLDKMLDAATIDVSAFLGMKDKDQVDQLRQIVKIDLDFEKLAAQRKQIYDDRTYANRELKELQAQFSAIPEPNEETPLDRVDTGKLLTEQKEAYHTIDVNQETREELADLVGEKHSLEGTIKEYEEKILEAKELLAKTEKMIEAKAKEVKKFEDPDIENINKKIAGADGLNKKYDEMMKRKELEKKIEKKEKEIEDLNNSLDSIDKEKDIVLSLAKFPVKGLSFNEDGILYKGIPFAQASGEERIQVAMAIGMSKKPKVKLILIRDASLLDKKNLAIIQKIAEKENYLVIMERVDDTSPTAVIIEDGYVYDKKAKAKIIPEKPVEEKTEPIVTERYESKSKFDDEQPKKGKGKKKPAGNGSQELF